MESLRPEIMRFGEVGVVLEGLGNCLFDSTTEGLAVISWARARIDLTAVMEKMVKVLLLDLKMS
jgi:hypothetical protein